MFKKGVELALNTVIIVVVLVIVLATLLYFFYTGTGPPIWSIIYTSQIESECTNWGNSYHYAYNEFYKKEDGEFKYKTLITAYGSPVKASYYCKKNQGDVIVKECTNNSKCGSTIPNGFAKCCCEVDCNSGNCGWGTFC
jgi:hypothetical protein